MTFEAGTNWQNSCCSFRRKAISQFVFDNVKLTEHTLNLSVGKRKAQHLKGKSCQFGEWIFSTGVAIRPDFRPNPASTGFANLLPGYRLAKLSLPTNLLPVYNYLATTIKAPTHCPT